MTALTSQHSAAAMSQLLLCRPPGDKFIRDVWRAAAEDRACLVSTIKHLVYSLEGKSCSVRGDMYSANVSLTAIHGPYEMLIQLRMADMVRTLFPHIFSGLLVSLTSGMSFSLPSDTDIQSQQRGFTAGFDADTSRSLNERCVRSLKALFDLIGQSDISDQMVMVRGWQQLLGFGFDQGVVLLAQAMTASAGDDLFQTVHRLASQIIWIQDCQAVQIIIFFGELLKAPCLSELGLTDMVINSLIRYLCWYDSSLITLLLYVRTLKNIDFGARQRCWSVTDVLMSLLGNPENSDVFTLAVLSCLQKNILEAPAGTIRPFLNAIYG
ncbi:hypothetical protein chiPu_0000791 [Chiloscyllium punctatum]|uniref:Uncharacterized protein n=1 Tax=Chiloscyllium punctatum TaxID=137246 RepID=A0A401RW74_CHIPU|nr:hypothetical protein [Chiloscyllium punctatum]